MIGKLLQSKTMSLPLQVILIIVACLLLMVTLGSQKAHAAATADIPNQADFSSNDLALMVADYGGSYELDARQSVVKVFFTASSGTVTIFDGNVCRYPTGIDSISGDPSTVYRLAPATASEAVDFSGPPVPAVGSTFNCVSRNLSLSISGLTRSTVPGHEAYFVAYFYADMWGSDSISFFRLRSSSGFISYYSGSTSKFALGQAYILPQRYADYKLTFAPQCSLQSGQTQSATIRWYDADQGNGNQDVALGSTLVKISPSGTRTTVGAWANLPGGNATPGSPDFSYTFTAEGRYRYEWNFTNVQSQNGIQFQLPYDSINYDITCNDAPTIVSFTANCNQVTVRADTQGGHNYSARLIVNGVDRTEAQFLDTGNADNSTVTFDVSSFKDFGSRSFSVRVRDDVNGIPETSSAFSVPACLRYSCGQASTNPANPEPNQPFDMTVTFNVVNVGSGTTASIGSLGNSRTWYIRLRVSPGVLDPAQQIGSGTLMPGGASSISATRSGLSAPLGTYDAFWSVSNTSGGAVLSPPGVCNEEDAVEVTEKPFFQVVNGDIAAGVTTAGLGCPGWGVSSNPADSLNAWNNDVAGAANVGAGTNLAVISGTGIIGVASAQGRGSPPQSLAGLSFSSFSLNNYGGFYPNDMPCPTDYYDLRNSVSTVPYPPGSVPSTNNVYTSASDLTIPGGAIGLNSRPVVFVEGNVLITGNITLAGGATNVDSLPNVYIIARGNIFIAPGVTRLDGVYIAQPDLANSRGKIYTCSNGFAVPSAAQINGFCRTNRLDVNGAFIAKELKFYRSIGSLSGNLPAEIFNTTPNTWLAAPCVISGCSSTGADGYKAITSLPPVL